MTVQLRSLLPVLVAGAVCGCAGSTAQVDASTTRDSAGVRIVENVRGAWTTPWRVVERPLLSIGSVDGDPDHELDQVTGAVGLPNGGVVVANAGRLQLLFYDQNGNLLHRSGGRGGGPGEFQSLEWVARYGSDSVITLDVRNHRVSYFDVSGSFGRSLRLEPNSRIPFPRPVGFLADGSLVATQGGFYLGGDPPVRVVRPEAALFRYDPAGGSATLLGSFPGFEWVMVPSGPGRRWERRGRPFGRATVYAAADDRFYVADNETYEIRVYSVRGRLIQMIRKAAPVIAIEPADIRAFEDSVLAHADDRARALMRVLFDNLPPPPRTYAAYAPDICVDADLNLWVRESSRPGQQVHEWSVFSPGGELLGTVPMPRGISVLEIGSDYVLGLQRDTLDVEYVRKFQLRKSQ